MSSYYEIKIGLCDWLNPGFGYFLKVEEINPEASRVNKQILFISNDPETGQSLTYEKCVEIAAKYKNT